MGVDPTVLQAIDGAVRADPSNAALRLHLIDLLLDAEQYATALGHCEFLLSQGGDADVQSRRQYALAGLGVPQVSDTGVDDEAEFDEGEVDEAQFDEADDNAYDTESATPPTVSSPAKIGVEPDTDEAAINELFDITRPELTLDDVAGMEEVKQRLRMSFLEPMRNAELRKSFGHSLRSSLLLWGPPGCGKTYLAKALAGELGLYFIHVGIADILQMYLGNSERNVKKVFEEAREMQPTVLFIDELDALGHKRSQATAAVRPVINQLLIELDGAQSDNEGLFVLGATNQMWDIEPALMRPGRFDRKVLVLPPDLPARRAILAHHLRNSPSEDLDVRAIAARTDGFSGADLAHVCNRAVEMALHDSVRAGQTRPVSQRHLETALRDTSPSISSWLSLAENYVAFSDNPAEYADLDRYLRGRSGRRRRR